jgi:signal transduction histidine kinase
MLTVPAREARGVQAADIALALVLTLLAQLELADQGRHGPAAVALSLLATGGLVWRRQAPFVAGAAVALVPALEASVLDAPPLVLGNGLAVLVAVYSAAVALSPARSLVVAALALVSFALLENSHGTLGAVSGDAVMIGSAWLVGWMVQRRSLEVRSRLEEADQEVRGAEARADAALGEERRRIARELHDVVSHAMTVVVLQARGARTVLGTDPETVRGSLDAIERSGQDALEEMRRLVALLREPIRDTAPQPGLGDLPELLATVSQRQPVDFRETGPPVRLGPGAELAAYRLVQECLTNALRHAPRATVEVRIDRTPACVTIMVSNDLPVQIDASSGGGLGLAGLDERLGLYGGRLVRGPEGGRWRVVATIPAEPSPGVAS